MDDVGEKAKLALEPVQHGGVEPLQRLQCDRCAALLVERLVDDAHPPDAQLASNIEPLALGDHPRFVHARILM